MESPYSSNINEVIKTVLNFYYFFAKRFCMHQKAQNKKTQKRNQAKVQNANKRIKISNVLKKHLSRK